MKPTQDQFAAWLDSFVHKDDLIQMSNVDGLTGALNSKADSAVVESMEGAISAQQLATTSLDRALDVERSRAVQEEASLLALGKKVYDSENESYMICRVMNQAQYDALTTKDACTIYLIQQ